MPAELVEMIMMRHIMGGRAMQVRELGKWGAAPSVHEDGTVTYPPGA